MRKQLSNFILSFLRRIKKDSIRYEILKVLFARNNMRLNGFKSFYNDRFFIYNLDNSFFPSQILDWSCNYKTFEEFAKATSLFYYQAKEGDIVIDIGAGMGEEAIVISKRIGAGGKIYAIEANPKVAQVLSEVVQLNSFKHVEVHNVAIYKDNCELFLEDEYDSYLAGTVRENTNSMKSLKVNGIRLDTFLDDNNIQRVDLLKTNIEGAERFVIESIGKEHIKRIRNVAISCHDFRYEDDGNEFYKTKDLVTDYLKENGFKVMSQHTGVRHIDDYIYGVNKTYAPYNDEKRLQIQG